MLYERLNRRPSRERPERQAQWEAARQEVEQLVDRLGTPVDQGIRDSVVALRLLGLKTSMSCEGHLHAGMQAPWIDFNPQVSKEIREREERALAERNHDQLNRLRREVNALVAKEWHKLLPLLDEFYRNRIVAYDRRLVLTCTGETTRLMSQGGEIQYGADEEIARGRLRAYRLEMDAFTRFLREKFLTGS